MFQCCKRRVCLDQIVSDLSGARRGIISTFKDITCGIVSVCFAGTVATMVILVSYIAFAREMMEELRIDVAVVPYQCTGKLNPQRHKVSGFMHVYVLKTNDVPHYNTDDFIEYYWLTPQELLDKLTAGDACKDDFT